VKSRRFVNMPRTSKSSVFDLLKMNIPTLEQVLFVLPPHKPLVVARFCGLDLLGADLEEGEFESTFPPTLIHYYVAFRAYDRFLQRHGRAPGSVDAAYDTDVVGMTRLAIEVLGEAPSQPEMVVNACAEM
jgi:hypothetical protein